MAKYDFNLSTYAKFWGSRDARQALTLFVNDPTIVKRLPAFWRSQFSVDPILTQRNNDGTALFSANMRKQVLENMLDWRAPLAETQVRDKKGLEHYEGTIPDFAARGFVEQAMEREAKERMFEEYFGSDAQILSAYADDIQAMVLEADSTLSHLAAMAISKAEVVYNYGSGIVGPIYKAPVPAENFVPGGSVSWADNANCKLLDQMEKIEQDFRDRTAYAGPLKWQMTRAMFNTYVLKNAQVIAYINDWRTINDKPNVAGWSVNEKMFNEAFATNNPKISPIEIVEEKQYNEGSPVHGWAENIAVLRPQGYAGQLKRAELLDRKMAEKYGSKVIDKVFANLDIFTIMNTTLNNGDFKEWHTDLFVSAVPVLEEFLNHVIVATTTTV